MAAPLKDAFGGPGLRAPFSSARLPLAFRRGLFLAPTDMDPLWFGGGEDDGPAVDEPSAPEELPPPAELERDAPERHLKMLAGITLLSGSKPEGTSCHDLDVLT